MKNTDLLQAFGGIDPELITDAAPDIAKKPRQRAAWVRWASIAACLALLISGAGIGTYAHAAEVREYNIAIKFFTENDLPAEGLTRGEIKKVYQDIITESFKYSKTAEVIASSISAFGINGTEILQDAPTPEEVAELWNYKTYNSAYLLSTKNGISYEHRAVYSEGDSSELICTYIEKYEDGKQVWSTPVTGYVVRSCCAIPDGVIAYGNVVSRQTSDTSYTTMTRLDESGNIVWQKTLHHGFETEYISLVLENEDGSFAVFSRGDQKYLCLGQYTSSGEVIDYKKTDIGNYGISNATRLGDGYLVHLYDSNSKGQVKILRLDCNGELTDRFNYETEDSCFYITDMIEFNGLVYLSAYATPKLKDKDQNGGARYEIDGVLNYLFDNHIWQISSEELTPLMHANYTAILLACDSGSVTPREFYSVDGSRGGKLSINAAGELVWNVESITASLFSPATSAFTIAATCTVFKYTYATNGSLISQEKTGELTTFRK